MGSSAMKTKANLFRTLVMLWVVLAAEAVMLFGVDPRSAETQTTAPSYYKVQDLGTLGGSSSWVSAINDSGQVIGSSYLAGDQNRHAFLYKDGKTTDLGTLGGASSEAKGINGSGQVVGWSDNSSGVHRAFIYDSANGMKDLNDSIPADSGWTITSASAINNEGQIAATGHKVGVGTHALLLTPTSDTPPPDDAPSPPAITSPLNNTYDTDGSFSVSGNAEAASTVEIFEGVTSRGTAKADASSGAWSKSLSGVSEGAHTYTARATDVSGKTSSASDPVTVTVDTK